MGQHVAVGAHDTKGIPSGGEVVKLCDVGGEFPARLITELLAEEAIGAVVQSNEMPLEPGWNFGARPWGQVLVLDADLPRASEIVRKLNEEIECEGGHDFTASHTWFPNMHVGRLNRSEPALLLIVLLLLAMVITPSPAVLAALIALAALPRIRGALAEGLLLLPAGMLFAVAMPLLAVYAVLRAAALALWDWVDRMTGGLLRRGNW